MKTIGAITGRVTRSRMVFTGRSVRNAFLSIALLSLGANFTNRIQGAESPAKSPQSEEPSKIAIYKTVQAIKGVENVCGVPVTLPGQTTKYILVAYSARLSGWVEIAPTCVGANKIPLREIQDRVAKVEGRYDAQLKAKDDLDTQPKGQILAPDQLNVQYGGQYPAQPNGAVNKLPGGSASSSPYSTVPTQADLVRRLIQPANPGAVSRYT